MPILSVPITPLTPKKLIPYAAGPVLPFKSSPPRPDFTFRKGHTLAKGFKSETGFVFKPKQPPFHFLYLFRHNFPQAHITEHAYFCPDRDSCPFHY